MFNFLKGKMGGMMGGGAAAAGGNKIGFMDRMRQNVQRPQFQQAMAGMGAQMMGLDPAMGQMAAQGMQQRRMNQGFQQGIGQVERQQFDPRQFMPLRQPMREQFGLRGGELLRSESQGGGQFIDPRLLAMRQRFSGPTY